MAQIPVLLVGKWSLAYSKSLNGCVLSFQFTDHEPLNLAIPIAEAVAMAEAILEQQKNPPPTPDRIN